MWIELVSQKMKKVMVSRSGGSTEGQRWLTSTSSPATNPASWGSFWKRGVTLFTPRNQSPWHNPLSQPYSFLRLVSLRNFRWASSVFPSSWKFSPLFFKPVSKEIASITTHSTTAHVCTVANLAYCFGGHESLSLILTVSLFYWKIKQVWYSRFLFSSGGFHPSNKILSHMGQSLIKWSL